MPTKTVIVKDYELDIVKSMNVPTEPYNLVSTDTESYSINGLGEVLYCYLSPHLGVFIRNLETKNTSRFLSETELLGLEYCSNKNDNTHVLVYKTIEGIFIKFHNGVEYISKKLNINVNRFFIFYAYEKVSLVFKNLDDDLVYEINSTDGYESMKPLSQKVFFKEDIYTINIDPDGTVKITFEVVDNTLLSQLTLYKKHLDRRFISYPIDISEFEETLP